MGNSVHETAEAEAKEPDEREIVRVNVRNEPKLLEETPDCRERKGNAGGNNPLPDNQHSYEFVFLFNDQHANSIDRAKQREPRNQGEHPEQRTVNGPISGEVPGYPNSKQKNRH